MNKKYLLRFIGWFFTANALLFFLVAFRYLTEILPFSLSSPTMFNKTLVGIFVAFAMIGHFALLAFLPALLVIPFVLFLRNIFYIQVLCVGVASFAFLLLITDTFVFKQFHYHLNGIILQMLFAKEFHEIFQISQADWLFAGSVFLAIILLEGYLAYWIKKILDKEPDLQGKTVGVTLATCLFFAYEIFLLGGLNHWLSLTPQARAFPLFNNFLAAIVPLPDSLTRVEILGSTHFVQPKQVTRALHYPLNSLHFKPHKQPLNLVIIAVDAWRFDMFSADVMPNVHRFSAKTWQFMNHWSGGNSTQAGIFSLFYGIPATYWSSMLAKQQGPVFIKALLDHQYQTGIYGSAPLTLPALNRTVFADIPNLAVTTPGKTSYMQDQVITQKFFHFLTQAKESKKPFFSFLFYDGAHAYCRDGNTIHIFQPEVAVCKHYLLNNDSDPLPYLNRYRNALRFVDQQIGMVLHKLKTEGLLKNTVIILTGDHGQEFNDNHLGYWEHASNYTHYQVQTPLFIYWPNEKPAKFTHWTSHFDISATLMNRLLGCTNSPTDFCTGHSLLDPKNPPHYLVISSYIDFGIVEPDQITTIYATGNYAIHNQNYALLPDAKLHFRTLQQALIDIRRFYD